MIRLTTVRDGVKGGGHERRVDGREKERKSPGEGSGHRPQYRASNCCSGWGLEPRGHEPERGPQDVGAQHHVQHHAQGGQQPLRPAHDSPRVDIHAQQAPGEGKAKTDRLRRGRGGRGREPPQECHPATKEDHEGHEGRRGHPRNGGGGDNIYKQ